MYTWSNIYITKMKICNRLKKTWYKKKEYKIFLLKKCPIKNKKISFSTSETYHLITRYSNLITKYKIQINKSNFQKLDFLIERGQRCIDINLISVFYYSEPSVKKILSSTVGESAKQLFEKLQKKYYK